MRRWGFLALLALPVLAGCAGGTTGPVKELQVTVKPETIRYGVAATVMVRPTNGAGLSWVKGTVVIPSMKKVPEVKLKYDEKSKSWVRKFPPIPPVVAMKPGEYTVKVWGKGNGGGRYEGSTTVMFK